jgi:hypothetical protein
VLLQVTVADWAQAYAELVMEKDALASVSKEKDTQLAVLTKKTRILTKEKDALAKEKDALAKEKDALAKEKDALAQQLAAAISQFTALGNSTGLLCTLVAIFCQALFGLSAHSFCAHRCVCDVCSCSGRRCRSCDSGEASSRSRCQARAETRAHSELDHVHAATCHIPVAHSDTSPHSVPQSTRRRAISEWRGAAAKEDPAGVADARRRAPLPHRGPRSVRPTATVASKGLPAPSWLATFEWQPCNLYMPRRVAACRRACGTQHRAPCAMATCTQHAPCRPRSVPGRNAQLALRSLRHARGTIAHLWFTPLCTLLVVAGGSPLRSRRLPAKSSSSRSLLETARTPPPLPSLPLSRLACANPATRSPHPAAA